MSAAMIEQLLLGLLQAAPQFLQMLSTLRSGGTVSATDVNAIITKYGIDRAVFVAHIAAADAAVVPAAQPLSGAVK